MTPAVKKQISLLPQENDPNNIVNKTINWLTSVGRVVIIFTELVVVAAFVSRFWLDRTNADLSETLRQQKAILDSTKSFQEEFTVAKNRLTAINSLIDNSNITGVIDTLFKSTPEQIFYQNIKINPDDEVLKTELNVNAFDNKTLVDFITNLMLNPDIDNVYINKIEKAPKTSYMILSLSVTFKKDFVNKNEI